MNEYIVIKQKQTYRYQISSYNLGKESEKGPNVVGDSAVHTTMDKIFKILGPPWWSSGKDPALSAQVGPRFDP